MNTENPIMKKKSGLLNIKQKVNENNTGEEFTKSINNNLSILNIIDKPIPRQEEKTMIGVKLKKSIADKVKSFSYENNMTVTQLLEDVIEKMFDSIELNEEALEAYENKYKKKKSKKRK